MKKIEEAKKTKRIREPRETDETKAAKETEQMKIVEGTEQVKNTKDAKEAGKIEGVEETRVAEGGKRSSWQEVAGGAVRWVLIGAGVLSVGLGVLGAVLPVLPTTPFLLLALWCFARSSIRLHRWLLGNRLFGAYLRGYRDGNGVPKGIKVGTLLLLWSTILLSACLVEQWWVRGVLLAVAIGVSIHILRLKNGKKTD